MPEPEMGDDALDGAELRQSYRSGVARCCAGCGAVKGQRCEPGCPEHAARLASSGRFDA